MAISTSDIQALYIAYFNRPADFLGLSFWQDAANAAGSVEVVANEFSKSKEYTDLYAGKSTAEIIDTIYMNLFGRHAEPDGITFWGKALQNGAINIGNAAYSIFRGAQNEDKVAVESKLAAAQAFYAALDTGPEIVGYSGEAANNVVKAWMSGITTKATLDAATTASALAAVTQAAVDAHDNVSNAGQTISLTTGVDAVVGTLKNDTINATNTTFTGLDTIDGSTGKDTLNIADVAGGIDLSLATVKNVESTVVTSTGAVTNANLSGWTGLTSAIFSTKNAGGQSVTAADTTAVTVSNTAGATVSGGSTINVSVTNTAAFTKLIADVTAAADLTAVGVLTTAAVAAGVITAANKTTIDGAANVADAATATTALTNYNVSATSNSALTAATVKGANVVTVTDGSTNADKLASVTLDGNIGASTLTGKAITSVSVANQASNVTITNATAHAEAITLNKVTGGTIADANATSVSVTASGTKSSGVTVSAGAATSASLKADVDLSLTALTTGVATAVTIAGAGKTTITTLTTAATATVNASAATGAVTISSDLGNNITYTGGTGADSISVAAGGTKALTTGAGDDVVTAKGAFGTGGSVDAGAGGNDTLAGAAAVVSALAAADLAKFTNFETLKITDVLTNGSSFDVGSVAGVVNFTAAAGVAPAGTATAANLGANANVTIAGDLGTNTGTLAVTLKADTGSDVVNLVLNSDYTDNNDATANAIARTITLNTSLVETVNVKSTGTMGTITPAAGYKADVLTNTLALTDNALVTLKVNGDKAISFASAAGMTKLATIDASANTGGAIISVANAATDGSAAALTIKGSATAANSITGSGNADVIVAGAAGDTITGGGKADQITLGAGNDKVVFAAATDSTLIAMDVVTGFKANTYGQGTNGAATSAGASTDATKINGDVIDLTFATPTALEVSVQSNAADAQTFLQNAATDGTVTGVNIALDSSSSKLYIDIDNNGTVDSVIQLVGVTTITAAAFVV